MLLDLAGLVSAVNAGRRSIRGDRWGGRRSARPHPRTEDRDIVPDPDRENLDGLGNVLVGLDARLASNPERRIDPEIRQAPYRGRNLTVATRLGDLDVVQRMPGIPPWEDLARDAETAALGDVPLKVCSRAHLIAMKRARASLQDQADIEALEPDS